MASLPVSRVPSPSKVPILAKEDLKEAYSRTKRRLFVFDYDGTLTPIVRDPNEALPTPTIISTLQLLTKDPKNSVWIVSGRDQAFLANNLASVPNLGLSAEHGSFIRYPNSKEWLNLTTSLDMSWQEEVFSVFKTFTERTPGAMVERKRCSVTWHYRKADQSIAEKQAAECKEMLCSTIGNTFDVEVMSGKANLEVRPSSINKGEIVKRLLAEPLHDGELDFCFCAGDDRTDEDMFHVLQEHEKIPFNDIFSIAVGPDHKLTLARWHVLEPHDIIDTINDLTNHTSLTNGSL